MIFQVKTLAKIILLNCVPGGRRGRFPCTCPGCNPRSCSAAAATTWTPPSPSCSTSSPASASSWGGKLAESECESDTTLKERKITLQSWYAMKWDQIGLQIKEVFKVEAHGSTRFHTDIISSYASSSYYHVSSSFVLPLISPAGLTIRGAFDPAWHDISCICVVIVDRTAPFRVTYSNHRTSNCFIYLSFH